MKTLLIDFRPFLLLLCYQLQAIVSFALSMPVLSRFYEKLLSPLAVQ
jgi:hypothetical protein